MDCNDTMDGLVKSALVTATAPPGWVRVDFDREGRAVAGVFVLRKAALLVNSRGQLECETSFRCPDNWSRSIGLKAAYRLSCPLNQEREVARALYDPAFTPKQMVDRHLAQAAREFVAKMGAQAFLDNFPRLRSELEEYLGPRLAVLTRLSVDRLALHTTAAPPRVVALSPSNRRVNLADNGFGVPVSVGVELVVPAGQPDAHARAQVYAESEGELQKRLGEWVDSFFGSVTLHDLLNETAQVEERLKRHLQVNAAPWGRTVGSISLRAAFAGGAQPVEDRFDCWLADGSNLEIVLRASLWNAEAPRASGTSEDRADIWPALAQLLKARARAILDGHTYFQFEAGRDAIFKQIAAAARDGALRMATGISLQLRERWSHEALLAGLNIDRTVESNGHAGGFTSGVRVALRCVLDRSKTGAWLKWNAEGVEEELGRLVDETVSRAVGRSRLGEYMGFDGLRATVIDSLRSDIAAKFGLALERVDAWRIDDEQRNAIPQFYEDAPEVIVEHPRRPELQFDVSFRFIETAVESGTPFPVYPATAEQLKQAVIRCIRELLSELPVSAVIGIDNQNALRTKIKHEIPRRIQATHYVRIEILTIVERQPAELTRLERRLVWLLERLSLGGASAFDRQEWIEEATRLAPLVERQGGHAPWIELAAHGIEPRSLAAGAAPEPLALPEPPPE